MSFLDSKRTLRVFLYGGGTSLLALDLVLLLRSALFGDFIPIVPVLAGILTAIGLLLVVYAEQRARQDDRRRHHRLSLVSHQLENPLKNLQSDLDLLLKHAKKLPAEQRLQIRRMETNSATLLANIRDVFLMLQALESPISRDVRTYDLCTLLEEAHRRTEPLATAQNVELIYQAHCQSAPVKVDRRLFLIAMEHIIDNGFRYTRKPGQVNIAIIKGQNHARIIVQDRGIGIRGPDKDLVFEPFARGENAAKYDPDGIGVGLALSRLIFAEFNTSLDFRPKPGGTGTEFITRLPLVQNK